MRIPTSGLASIIAVLLVVLGGLCHSVEAQEGSTYTIVAFTGQASPGGGAFATLGPPTIGSDGTIAFTDSFSGGDTYTSRVFAGTPGSLRLVAASGQTAPGGTASFVTFDSTSVSKDGRVAFNAEVGGDGQTSGIWAETAGGLQLATLADDTADLYLTEIGTAAFRSGAIGVKGQSSPDDSFGILLFGAPGALGTVLTDGQTLGSAQLREVYDSGDSQFSVGSSVDVNESGNVALKVAVVPSPSPTPTPLRAIYAGSPTAPVPVAVENDDVPGLSGFQYGDFSQQPTISANGKVAFSAYLNNGLDQQGLPSQAVFAGSPGAIAPVALEGAAVPTTTGVTFGGFSDAVVNSTGDVIFGTTIYYPDQTSRQGIWLQRTTGPAVLIAVSGMALPTPTGAREVESVSFAGPGTFNDLNEFVFEATFAGGDHGIYVADTQPGVPTIHFSAPAKPRDRVTMASKIVVAGTASDDTGVAKVEYTVAHEASADRRGHGRHHPRFITSRVKLAKGGTNWKFNVPLTMGLNLISVTATDKLGNVSPAYKIRVLRYSCPPN